jgi:hypothetical protein
MERIPIYLESDDEITSVVDKLKSAEGVSLDIVIPKEAIMLQSVINLKLLKRQAESLGKEITIVTTDKVGQKLAEQIGIPVVAKEGQEPKEVNMSEVEKPAFSEDDIEVKQVPIVPDVPNVVGEEKRGGVVEETKEVVTPSTGAQTPSGKKGWFGSHKKGIWIAAGFVILALAILAYIFVPLANITLKLAAENKTLDLTFTADKAATEVSTEENKIPAREVVEELEKEETFQATGKKDVGEKATGKVKICNKEDDVSFTFTGGSKITDAAGKIYKTQTNVIVPEAGIGGGDVEEKCSAEVTVVADKPGANYNKSTTGDVYSVPVTGAYRALSTTPFTGGSTKEITYILATDIKSAKAKLTETMNTELKTKVNDALEGGESLLEGALKVEEVSAEPSSAVGAEVSEFKLKMKSKATALVFKQDDLKKLAEGVLAQEIGATKEIVEADSLVSEAKLQKLDIKAGTVEATLAGEAYIATKINQDELKNSINGDPQAVAENYLNNLEGIDEVQFRFFPSFYKRVPRINSHIYFKIEMNKTQS